MKMRTTYFKVNDMDRSLSFWESTLGRKAHKKSKYWSELLCDNINFGLLWTEGFTTRADQSNFVPVFELKDAELEVTAKKAMGSGGTMVVDIADHPDKMSYVLADLSGNEFELTKFRG